MKSIRYADFDLDQYAQRIARLQEAMHREGLDALLLTDPANLRYLLGFQNFLQLSATRLFVAFIPSTAVEDSFLFIPHDCQDAPQTWVENVVFWDEGHEPPFDDRMADLAPVTSRISRLGLAAGRIGMESGPGTRPGLPLEQFDRLRSLLPHAELVDSSSLLWSLRKVKSEAEIEVLRRIAAISVGAIEEGLASLTEGVTEKRLYREIQARMFSAGADGQGLLCVQFGVDGWTRANMIPTDERRLALNEWAYVDGGGTLQGYYGDVCRMAVLGQANSRQRKIYESVGRAQSAIFEAIKPGVPCCELYRAGMEVLKRDGWADLIDSLSVGHGIGLNIHEYPDLHLSNREPLQEGMVLSIEPWVLGRESDLGLFNLEDMVVVRSWGAERLGT